MLMRCDCIGTALKPVPTAITTAWRHRDRYCPPSASNAGDCSGVMRGVEGLGFATVGFDLILIGVVAALGKTGPTGRMTDELHDMPATNLGQQDVEKGGH